MIIKIKEPELLKEEICRVTGWEAQDYLFKFKGWCFTEKKRFIINWNCERCELFKRKGVWYLDLYHLDILNNLNFKRIKMLIEVIEKFALEVNHDGN